MVPPYTRIDGTFMRRMPMSAPGRFLSHPPIARTPSMNWLCTAVSIASAITSRETSEYFIPSVPIEMPSVTVMVPNICGIAPAARAAVRDADDGLLEVRVGIADGAQHGAVGRTRHALGDRERAVFVGHGRPAR